ncbi:Hypothetical Protein OBI_RACECAR_60 [Arthrobacter phage Racecar]|nr:hypothetical protein PBI_RACECAR_142 [Arthrobacter phage Racecar]
MEDHEPKNREYFINMYSLKFNSTRQIAEEYLDRQLEFHAPSLDALYDVRSTLDEQKSQLLVRAIDTHYKNVYG